MVNASKILTVSYGTFSCTLEGFDNPFATMRSIAEYFRDLAADDRYFGAEPPTPDAEMLHRIAEREINRRVEAKVSKNGVVLRQIEDDQAQEVDLPDEAEPSQTATESLTMMAVSHADAPGAANSGSEVADVDATEMDAATHESVAEKLRRIRAAVARAHVEPQFSGTFAEDEHANELFRARSIDAAFTDTSPEVEAEQDESPVVESAPETSDVATDEPAGFDGEILEQTVEEAEAEIADDEAADAPNAFEEDAAEDAVEVAIDSLEEVADEVTADLPDESAGTVEQSAEETADLPEPQAGGAEEDAPEEISQTAQDDGEGEPEGSMQDPEPLILDTVAAAAPEQDAEAADAEFEEDDTAQEVDIDGLTAMLAAEDAPEAPSGPVAEGEPELAPQEPETAKAVEDKPEPKAPPVMRARVVKMSRKEFMARYVETSEDEQADSEDAAFDATEQPETAQAEAAPIKPKPTPEDVRASLGETGLSKEDEDDLINELLEAERDAIGQSAEGAPDAEVVGDITTDPQTDASVEDAAIAESVAETLQADIEDTAAQDKPAQTREEISAALKAAVAPVSGPSGDNKSGDLSVDRLLRQADSELNNNDSSRRRSAIAHLKAAVAAVRADGGRAKESEAAEEARTMDRFRDDLARVVRPETDSAPVEGKATPDAKPVPPAKPESATRASSPEAPRARRKMPPLMLVSEQRIDKPAARDPNAEPVRPRRVQADDELPDDGPVGLSDDQAEDADDNIFGAAEDFSGYVAETGAEGIQELLEASAAFGTLVEGQSFNSRPQIMQRVLRFVPEGTVTREEGLRAFGVLLREGRLIRIQRGQFVLPETSRFRSDKKSAIG